MQKKRKVVFAVFFLLVLGIALYIVFRNQSIEEILSALHQLAPVYLIMAILAALSYVGCEGFMIWNMIEENKNFKNLMRCIGYSFIGFFYSGITPSASGGQPMQLYYMKRDGYSFSKSCATLTAIAATNKMVLVLFGVMIMLFGGNTFQKQFEGNTGWFYFGFLCLCFWVVVLYFIMFATSTTEKFVLKIVSGLEKIHLLKPSEKRIHNIIHFFDGYRSVSEILKKSIGKSWTLIALRIIQRMLLVVITVFIYKGFGLAENGAVYIFTTQLSVMISVDMLPVPGAQGISELLYTRVFESLFSANYLTASMCISRFFNFYLLLIIGGLVLLFKYILKKFSKTKTA